MGISARRSILLLITFGSLAVVPVVPPLFQDPAYHAFADQRVLFGIPRFLDVITNLPFLVVGMAGAGLCMRHRISGSRLSWGVFFAGVALVGIGSAYYHLEPSDRTLVWDRLPMAAGFAGVLIAVLGEHVNARIEQTLLFPSLLAGVLSVFWWSWTGDLRFYYWVQLLPMAVIPVTLHLFPIHREAVRGLLPSAALYAAAKAAELSDRVLYEATLRTISGHSLKHLVAAASCAVVLAMLIRRVRSRAGTERPVRQEIGTRNSGGISGTLPGSPPRTPRTPRCCPNRS